MDVRELQILLPAAATLGACAVVGSIVLEDRHAARAAWTVNLAKIARRLRAVRTLVEETDVAIALENGPDVTAEELVALGEELGSPQVGVTLDTGNPLAEGEDPLTCAPRLKRPDWWVIVHVWGQNGASW